MTWEETIRWIRSQPEYETLVDQAYFEEDLLLNVQRYRNRDEYGMIKELISKHSPNAKKLLDVGCGNGITAVNFARDGFQTYAVEPDESDTVGLGAIEKLKFHYSLNNLFTIRSYAESMPFESNNFDVVFLRQAMHHAGNLGQFVKECARVLKPEGIFFSVRDHVIYDEKDKEWFLQSHPLHKYYGGENAFTRQEYVNAMETAGLKIIKEYRHFDSPMNFYPLTVEEYNEIPKRKEAELLNRLRKKVGLLARVYPLKKWYLNRYKFNTKTYWKEEEVAGRMYSFIAVKK